MLQSNQERDGRKSHAGSPAKNPVNRGESALNLLEESDKYIPGTVLERDEMGGVSGLEFLNNIFFVTDGIMLSEVREISGVDGSTLQNWVKRGWLSGTVNKRYSKDQLARILIINMLRPTMQLERIDHLLHYINGDVEDTSDDIITESMLYEYVCRIIERISPMGGPGNLTREEMCGIVAQATDDYQEKMEGEAKRLRAALEIIVIAYYASLYAAHSAHLFEKLEEG